MNTKTTAEFDEYAETYDEGLKELLGTLGGDTEKFAEYKIRLLKSLLSFASNDKVKILDFGCGTGRSLTYLKEYFSENKCELFGCDVSEESLKVAKKLVPDAKFFLNASVSQISDFGEKYDICILACVLHHIKPEERKQWIQALISNLNSHGKIVVFEHNILNPVTKKIVLDSRNKVDNISWMLKMSEILDLLLVDNVMRLYWKGYTLFSPFRFPGVLSIEKCLKSLPFGAQQCVIVEKA